MFKSLLNALLLLALAASVNAAIYYNVKPGCKAKDKNTFSDITAAKDAVGKQIGKGLKDDIVVFLHQGDYRLDKPLEFDHRDGGTAAYSITYCPWPGDKVVLSGGCPVKEWTRVKDNLWTAKVPPAKGGKFKVRQLYCDDRRLPRGRFPNEGQMLKITALSDDYQSVTFDGDLPATSCPDAEIVVYQNWSVSRGILDKIGGASVHSSTPLAWVGHSGCRTNVGMYAYIENASEFVDTPGEWYFDCKTGQILYNAREGENPNDHNFQIPVLDKLVKVVGTQQNPVKNLHFVGLELAFGRWDFPQFGYRGIQAAHFGTVMDPNEPVYSMPCAIDFKYTQDCRMVDCRIAHIGSSAIGFGAGCRNNTIENCTIYDISGNGVVVGQRDWPLRGPNWLDADWADPKDIPAENKILDSHIYDCAVEFLSASAVYDAFTQKTLIARNEIHDLPYIGVSVGFQWNTKQNSHRNTRVEYNKIYDVLKKIADGGCIYTLGCQPGTVIYGNLLFDSRRGPWTFGNAPNNGIFFDEGSCKMTLEDNIIFRCDGGPVRYNKSGPEMMTWKKNYINVLPGQEEFPKDIARKAGWLKEYADEQP